MTSSELLQILKEWYRKILIDPNFEKLEQLLDTPNIFRILKAKRTEIRHSNFLWWLLDPSESHGLWEKILIKVLRDILLAWKIENISPFELENINFRKVEVLREHQNIDILIRLGDIIVCIENKFDTSDHSGQLLKYKNIVEKDYFDKKHIFIYLTPNWDDPNDKDMWNIYQNYSYTDFIKILELILLNKNDLRPAVYLYIKDYLITIKQEILWNDELNKLESELYNSHLSFLTQYNSKYLSINQNHDEIFERITASYIKHNKRIEAGEFPLFLSTLESLLHENNFIILKVRKESIVFTSLVTLDIAWEYGDDGHGRPVFGSNATIAFTIGDWWFYWGVTHLTNREFRDNLNKVISQLPNMEESKDRSGWYGWHNFWKIVPTYNISELEKMNEEQRRVILNDFLKKIVNPNIKVLEDLLLVYKHTLSNENK